MKLTPDQKIEWQDQGGSLIIPDGWFVFGADFDCDEPYITITKGSPNSEKKLSVPKALAYYLSMHFCGSKSMHNSLIKTGKYTAHKEIRSALGLD